MTENVQAALAMIQQQIKELDVILEQATRELNTVAGKERVEKWKARTIPLIAQHMGPQEAQRFSAKQPGPSFTNDLLEELGDDVELYRSYLLDLAATIKKTG
jgi:hypothetical protein